MNELRMWKEERENAKETIKVGIRSNALDLLYGLPCYKELHSLLTLVATIDQGLLSPDAICLKAGWQRVDFNQLKGRWELKDKKWKYHPTKLLPNNKMCRALLSHRLTSTMALCRESGWTEYNFTQLKRGVQKEVSAREVIRVKFSRGTRE